MAASPEDGHNRSEACTDEVQSAGDVQHFDDHEGHQNVRNRGVCSNVPTLKCTVDEYVGDHHFFRCSSHFVFSLLSALLKVNLSAHLDDAHDVGSEDLAEEQDA